MNRRGFLGSLAALTAGMALDPERALWVPGRKTYFDLSHTPDMLAYIEVACLDGRVFRRYPASHDGSVSKFSVVTVGKGDTITCVFGRQQKIFRISGSRPLALDRME